MTQPNSSRSGWARRLLGRGWRPAAHEAPSITVESAEGVAAYPGFDGSPAGDRARAYSVRRLREIRDQRDD